MYWNSRRVTARRTLPFSNATAAAAVHALQVAADKVRRLSEQHPDFFPLYTHEGRWKHDQPAWTNWCEGFLGGQMWIFHELGSVRPGRPGRALHGPGRGAPARRPGPRPRLRAVPDLAEEVGGHRRRVRAAVVITGGRTLATRFNTEGRFLRSFLAPDSTFIDIMMNVGIIALAGLESGDEQLLAVAEQHAPPPASIWSAATGRSATKASSIWRPASSSARAASRAGATPPPGPAVWPGRCTASPRCMPSPATRAGWPPPRLNADYWIEHTSGDVLSRRTTSTSRTRCVDGSPRPRLAPPAG